MSREGRQTLLRSAIVAVLLLLGADLAMSARGPIWWQKRHHPLKHRSVIAAASERNGVDPYLVAAVINAESGFRESEVSEAGAVGLMQLMPSTAVEVSGGSVVRGDIGPDRLKDAKVNIELGTRHLGRLLGKYESTETAVAAYNAGARRVDVWLAESHDGSLAVGFPETQRFVERVLRELRRYAELYPTAFAEVAQE